jgi:hypothetical protein
MAYTYLDITNEVLARMNEVSLTSSGFSSARGFQVQCKNAVNDSINFINHREFNWPFNHTTGSETLVAGTSRYSIPATAKTVDYETFRLVKDTTLGSNGGGLAVLDYKEYVDRYIDQEDDTTVQGGVPRYIVRTPDNNYLLYPYPNKAYTLKYEYYNNTTPLSAATDVPNLPELYRAVIADGATAYAYQYRGETDQYQVNWSRFNDGITDMQSILSNRFDYVRSTVVLRTGTNTSVFPSVS